MCLLMIGPSGLDRDFYVATLGDCGFPTDAVETIPAAKDWLAAPRSPNVIVIDLLPDPAQAWQFITATRRERISVPVVILTTLVRPDGANRQRARELGCAAFVAKPCAPRELARVVRRAVDGERGLEIVHYAN